MSEEPSPEFPPDKERIDLWLSGELVGEEAKAIERYFEENPPEDDGLDEEVMPEITKPDVAELIAKIKTDSPGGRSRLNKDSWREVVVPGGAGELGMLGNYEVEKVVATGGMGIVLKARDPELGRAVALKVLSPALATNATARERFLREAQAAAKLEHENILPIYSVHAEAVPYFVMRYVMGGTLQGALDAGRKFSTEELSSITSKIAAALGAAHAAGIVHRDIKPANILLSKDGENLWVCDFGIARSTEDPALTYAGGIAGTPHYMSPEQAAGHLIDGRSDLFSLGSVIYYCATGQQAFPGTTTAAVLQRVASASPIEISGLNRDLPRWFVDILEKLLAKDPENRFADVSSLNAALVRREPAKRRWPWKTAAAVAAAITAIVGLSSVLPIKAYENREFIIDGFSQEFPGLAAAIAAAPPGATIGIPPGKPHIIDETIIPADHPLVLVPAEPGTRPVLTTSSISHSGIVSQSPIKITGIDLYLNQKTGTPPIIQVTDASVHLEDCRITTPHRSPDSIDEKTKPRAIDLFGESSIDVVRCHFDTLETHAIGFRSLLRSGDYQHDPLKLNVRIEDSEFKSFYGICMYHPLPPGSETRIKIVRSKFASRYVLCLGTHELFSPTYVTATDSEFGNKSGIAIFRQRGGVNPHQFLTWDGEGNTFPGGRDDVVIGRSRFSKTATFHPISEFGTQVDPPSVEIAGSGKTYLDLGTALAEAPSGSTFLLRGEHRIVTPVYFRGTKEIHLRAAPGSSPVIIAAHPVEHAIFCFCPVTVRGITFRRPPSEQYSLPVIGIHTTGKILVEDCRFEIQSLYAPPPADASGGALSIASSAEMTLRRCRFDTPGGSAFHTGSGNLRLEDCFFAGNRAIFHSQRDSNAPMSISAEGCVFHCSIFYTNSRSNPLYPISLDVADSIVDITGSFFLLNGEGPEKNLSWSGRGNHYTSRSAQPGALAGTSSVGPLILPVFERLAIDIPATAAESRERCPIGL